MGDEDDGVGVRDAVVLGENDHVGEPLDEHLAFAEPSCVASPQELDDSDLLVRGGHVVVVDARPVLLRPHVGGHVVAVGAGDPRVDRDFVEVVLVVWVADLDGAVGRVTHQVRLGEFDHVRDLCLGGGFGGVLTGSTAGSAVFDVVRDAVEDHCLSRICSRVSMMAFAAANCTTKCTASTMRMAWGMTVNGCSTRQRGSRGRRWQSRRGSRRRGRLR